MNPLEMRRHVLTAESDINRVLLREEWQTMEESVRSLAHRAESFGSIASAAALLVTGLATFRHTKPVPAGEKPAWGLTLLKGAGMIATLWLAFRARGEKKEPHQPRTSRLG